MQTAIEALSADLARWADQSLPIHKGEDVPLAQMDQSPHLGQLNDLFFDSGTPDSLIGPAGAATTFLRGQSLSCDALRNCLFPELLRSHSHAEDLGLHFRVSGHFSYEMHRVTPQGGHAQLDQGRIDGPALPDESDAPQAGDLLPDASVRLSLQTGVGQDARLFWILRALSDDAVLHEATWTLRAPADTDGRMVVLLRTFGRGADVRALLRGFHEQSLASPHYRRILRNLFFVVLDTTPDTTAEDYADLAELDGLHMTVMAGANLGGGGNMSQTLYLLDQALAHSGQTVQELLLLDDDLKVSLESLCRHWATTLFRKDETIFTLPICIASDPRRIWEDGAFWGRFLDEKIGPDRTAIAPRFLRHQQDLGEPGLRDRMAARHYPEYATFIFFGLSYARFRELGYPAAFFLRGDDIEYSLRHQAAGGRIASNPNLCAWHEPAHSFGQEYMSIAHGAIINMRYGTKPGPALARFFQHRMQDHGAISDAQGLSLYGAVLQDLNSKALFLEHDFARRYVDILGRFKGFDSGYDWLPEELRHQMHAQADRTGGHVADCGFLYPKLTKPTRPDRVLLHNPHSGLHRSYDPDDPEVRAACISATAELARELHEFVTDFEDLQAHYQARFDAVSQADFWAEELALHPAATVLLQQER